MSKLILICLLIAMHGSLHAQNTISSVYYPSDNGFGLRYDRKVRHSGLYVSMSRGSYRISQDERINNHIKSVIGYMRYPKKQCYDFVDVYYSAGVSYHYYSNQLIEHSERVYRPVSLDLGIGGRFDHTMVGFCFDFLKWEGGINFGINF